MLSFMLDPRFKSFFLLSSFIGHEQRSTIVEEYDTKSLYFMFLECHHHLHPLAKFESGIIYKGVYVDYNLDIIKMTTNTCKSTKKLMNNQLLTCRQCQVDLAKTPNVIFNLGKTWSYVFYYWIPTCQILEIVRSQIEIKIIIFFS
jgi:hypothetical protein